MLYAGGAALLSNALATSAQSQGAAPANTQVIDGDIQVVLPEAFASAKPVYPMPRT